MLVGRAGDEVRKTTDGVIPTGGTATVTLDDPGRFERITAVVVNGSYEKAGWNGQDWSWTRDEQPIALALMVLAGGGGGTTDPGTGGGSTMGGGTTTGGGSTTGGGGGSQATLLNVKAAPAPRLAKAKALKLAIRSSVAGTFKATASVDAATARRLRLGKKATTVGTGKLAVAANGSGTLQVALSAKARARLHTSGRPVTIAIRLTFRDATGATTARTIKVTLKR